MRLLFDIETDGLLEAATKVHCIAAIDLDTGDRLDWGPDRIRDGIRYLSQADELVGHNILRFDLPILKRLGGLLKFNGRVLDTLVLSKLIWPDLKRTDIDLMEAGKLPPGLVGKHSIEAWGHRLGEPKGDYAKVKREQGLTEDQIWASWSQEMHDYCKQDVETNLKLWSHIDAQGYSSSAVELEHRIAAVCDQMGRTGVPFDIQGASGLHTLLVDRRGSIERELVERFGSWEVVDRKFVAKRDNKRLGYTAGVEVTKYKTVVFNPSSRDHIARVLTARGWKPTEFTAGGKPKIDEEAVSVIVQQYPEMAGLGEYLMLDKRISQLASGNNALIQVAKEGRIHGSIDPMGTVTGRGAHFRPNLAQVPNGGSPYGKEFRSLFYAPEGWSLVGADMSGLELRGLAHYLWPLDGGSYARTVLDGDPHWTHTVAMGLVPRATPRDHNSDLHTVLRNGSKTFVYAYIYGAGAWKLGEIIYGICMAAPELMSRFFPDGPSPERFQVVGQRIRQKFVRGIPGFQALRAKVKQQYERCGYMPGIDGRRIPCRSEHSALNAMIQNAGAVLCKQWVCDVSDALPEGAYIGLWVHDEMQIWCPTDQTNTVKELCEKHAATAGEPYGFRVRLDSEATIGRTWAETH